MLRGTLLGLAAGRRAVTQVRLPLQSIGMNFSTSNEQEDMRNFISDALSAKKFSRQEVENELSRLDKGNIKTMELLKNLNMRDWENLGITVGAARAIQDALWEQRHSEVLKKTETKMKLRRENSSKQESKQKRL